MMKDLKLGFQLLKYGKNERKGMIAGAVVALVLGVPLCIASMLTGIHMWAGYCFILGASILCQNIQSLYFSDLVMASPVRKRLGISVSTIMEFASSAVSYLLVLVVGGIVAVCSPKYIRNVCNQLILTSVLAAILSLFSGVCRKYFVASFIVVFLIIFLCPDDMKWSLPSTEDGWGLFAGVALIGMAIILCSSVLLYLINLALYKVPMSKLYRDVVLK